MLKSIVISYQDGDWSATAEPPVTLQDQLILFFNEDNSRSCLLNFSSAAGFGILALALAPSSGFVLTFRGVATGCSITDVPPMPDVKDPLRVIPIPPGSF
jgi:hypothetical protein